MLWDDPYRFGNTTLAPNTIVQAYRAKDACQLATEQGHRVVLAPMGLWYLRGDGSTWERIYNHEPFDQCQAQGWDAARQKLILGVRIPLSASRAQT